MRNNFCLCISGKIHHMLVIDMLRKELNQDILTFYNVKDILKMKDKIIFTIDIPIIKKQTLDILYSNNNVPLNLHSGDTTKYRGNDCEYWSLLIDGFIICTLHELTEKIDGGRIIAQAQVDPIYNLDEIHIKIGQCYYKLIHQYLLNPEIGKQSNQYGTGKYYKKFPQFFLSILERRIEKNAK